MKNLKKIVIAFSLAFSSSVTIAEPVSSLENAQRVTENRQAIFKLLGSNMAPLGAMAKGRIPFDAQAVEKYGLRLNQLSLMMADYLTADTRGHQVETKALETIWQKPEEFAKKIKNLEIASGSLVQLASKKNEEAIKKAIGGVGQSCGGCHDDFKAE